MTTRLVNSISACCLLAIAACGVDVDAGRTVVAAAAPGTAARVAPVALVEPVVTVGCVLRKHSTTSSASGRQERYPMQTVRCRPPEAKPAKRGTPAVRAAPGRRAPGGDREAG